MKNFYKGGRGLSFFRRQLYLFNLKNNCRLTTLHLPMLYRRAAVCRLLTIFVFSLFSNLVHAQEPRKDSGADGRLEIRPLQVGDTIPEELWNLPLEVVNHPDGKETITLNDYRDKKLIILDFWSTWCAPCIKLIPKLESIAEEMGSDFQAVAITSEPSGKISDFLKKRALNVWTVVNDSTFKSTFPRSSIPHEIWIKENKVFAITDAAQIEEHVVAAVMAGDVAALPEKRFNSSYDRTIPLLVDGNGGTASDLLYHSVITGYLDGIGGGGVDEVLPGRYRLRILNSSPVTMYQSVSS